MGEIVWRGHSCPRADTKDQSRCGKNQRRNRDPFQPSKSESARYIIPTAIIPTTIIQATMDTLDPAGEFLRITQRYRQMSDAELIVLMPQSSELTPMAQQALAAEVRSRGLKAEEEDRKPSASSPFKSSPFKPPPAFFEHESPKLRESASYDFPDADSPYDEDRKLVDLCTVWSVRDALKVQTILDGAGIPFFMGPEKATGVDEVTSDFAKGVGVQIMQIGLPWAGPAMRHYEPEDDPTAEQTEEQSEALDERPVRCPTCHSTEVVFEGLTSELGSASDDSSQKYQWTCDACGHHWEDDGVPKEE